VANLNFIMPHWCLQAIHKATLKDWPEQVWYRVARAQQEFTEFKEWWSAAGITNWDRRLDIYAKVFEELLRAKSLHEAKQVAQRYLKIWDYSPRFEVVKKGFWAAVALLGAAMFLNGLPYLANGWPESLTNSGTWQTGAAAFGVVFIVVGVDGLIGHLLFRPLILFRLWREHRRDVRKGRTVAIRLEMERERARSDLSYGNARTLAEYGREIEARPKR